MRNQMLICTVFMTIAAAACSDDDRPIAEPDMVSDNAATPMVFYQTEDGDPATEDTSGDAVVDRWYPGGVAELRGTDGERMTWAEVTGASGRVELSCTQEGTRVRVEAAGLEPDGVYTGWLAFFAAPGFMESGLDVIQAISPMGPPDGSTSEGVADAQGRLTIETMVPAATATVPMNGEVTEVPQCLSDAYEVHLVLAYHQDGRTCGDNPCDFPTFVEHVAWILYEGQLL